MAPKVKNWWEIEPIEFTKDPLGAPWFGMKARTKNKSASTKKKMKVK